MIERIKDLSLSTEYDTLRSGPGSTRRRLHILVIVSRRLARQTPFAVFKNDPIVRKPQTHSSLDAVQRGGKVHVSSIHDMMLLIEHTHVVYDQFVATILVLLNVGLLRRTRWR